MAGGECWQQVEHVGRSRTSRRELQERSANDRLRRLDDLVLIAGSCTKLGHIVLLIVERSSGAPKKSLKGFPRFASPNSTALAMESQEGPSSSLQQSPTRTPSDSISNPLNTLIHRSTPTPPRKDARRIQKDGKEGAYTVNHLDVCRMCVGWVAHTLDGF